MPVKPFADAVGRCTCSGRQKKVKNSIQIFTPSLLPVWVGQHSYYNKIRQASQARKEKSTIKDGQSRKNWYNTK
jgi:hypothetical protein